MAIDENGKVTFNEQEQAKVDEIIKERLARVKPQKPEDYDTLKELEEELSAFGFTGTAAEKREAIKKQREAYQQQAEIDKLEQQAREEGMTKAAAKRIKDLEDKLAKNAKYIESLQEKDNKKKTEAENKRKADEEWNKQVKEFQEAYEDVDLDSLANNKKFTKFIKGKNLSLKELYEDFVDLIGETQAEAIIKVKSKESRSTSSGKGSSSGGNHGLTTAERKVVDDWNKRNPRMQMTYKEYAERK